MPTSQSTVPSRQRGPAHGAAIAGGLLLLAVLFLLPSPAPPQGGPETLQLLEFSALADAWHAAGTAPPVL